MDIEYLRPGRLGERLEVGVKLLERRRSRPPLAQDIACAGRTLTRAKVTIACLDHTQWRPARIPAVQAARLSLHA